MAQMKDRLITALDIGTSKVSAVIAQVRTDGEVHVCGVGHQLCMGLNAGMVTSVEHTERAIRAAVDQAERAVGREVRNVFVSVNSAALAAEILPVQVDVHGDEIIQADIDRVLALGRETIMDHERKILHAQPACYAIDGAVTVRNPIGLFGEKLGVDIQLLTAEAGPIKNIEVSVRRAHLDIEEIVAGPIASGYGCLTEEERMRGVALIELGAGVTNIAVFAGGILVGCSTISVGSTDVTDDIARVFMTPRIHAERLKTLHGTVMSTAADNHEMVDVPPSNYQDGAEVIRMSRAQLSAIIRERISELFIEIGHRLSELGFVGPAARQVVLTGGGAQMANMVHFATTTLNKSVRIGRPLGLIGLPDALSGPGFSAVAGLVNFAVHAPEDARAYSTASTSELPRGRLAQLVRWLGVTF
jgi:cell division protein FtsA